MACSKHFPPLLAVVLLAAGCSKSQEPQSDSQTPETLSFTIRLNTSAILTRTSWGDDYPSDPGTALDNSISSLELHLVRPDGTSSPLQALPSWTPSGNPLYTCSIQTDDPSLSTTADGKFLFTGKLVARANAGSSLSSPFADSPFETSFGVVEGWTIPMWGVGSFDSAELIENGVTHLGSVDLLRAAAKITLTLDPELASDYRLANVCQTAGSPDFIRSGLLLPAGASDVANTRELSRLDSFNPDPRRIPLHSPAFRLVSQNKFSVYVAEAGTSADAPFAIQVDLEPLNPGRAPFSGEVLMAEYAADGRTPLRPFTRLVRNYEYEFTVTLADLRLLTTVRKWELGGKVHLEI